MTYKDKDKQKKANRAASKRYRESKQGMTETEAKIIPSVIPEQGSITRKVRQGESFTAQDAFVKRVANTGGEVSFKTVDGVVQDVHITLPACVPKILHARYAREPEYAKVIDKLLNHSLDELHLQAIWIPVWRYTAGPAAPLTSEAVA